LTTCLPRPVPDSAHAYSTHFVTTFKSVYLRKILALPQKRC
jgi:hypothetical protein